MQLICSRIVVDQRETLVPPILDLCCTRTQALPASLLAFPLDRLETDSRVAVHMQALREDFSRFLHPAPPILPTAGADSLAALLGKG